MVNNLKRPLLRDRAYLDALRDMPCAITGQRATDYEKVDPAHIGTAGRGLKSPDDEALPILHSVHQEMHNKGEASVLRERMPDWLLIDCVQAYAREHYRKWKEEQS